MSRLRSIVARFGGSVLDGGARALIPGPGHSKSDRSVSLLETEDGRILIHCFSPRNDWREVRDMLAAEGLLDENPRSRRHKARERRAWRCNRSPKTSALAPRAGGARAATSQAPLASAISMGAASKT